MLFYQRVLAAMKESEKTEVIVGIEPTGHYWLNLAYFLEERGIPLAMVNCMSSDQKSWTIIFQPNMTAKMHW